MSSSTEQYLRICHGNACPSKRIRSLRNSFRKHRVKRLKSLLSITPQEPSTRSTGMMRTRLSMFSTGKLRWKVRGGTPSPVWSQVFYESPEDVHTVSRNASKTKPAKFVVFFIKNEGAPILTPNH